MRSMPGVPSATPAQHSSASNGPPASSRAASTDPRSARSTWTGWTPGRATAARSMTTTSAPASSSSSAAAAPMPEAPPTTRARFPSKRKASNELMSVLLVVEVDRAARGRWDRSATSPLLVGDAGGLGVPGGGGDALGPQLPLEHPADGAPGELVAELEVAGQGEVGELVEAPAEQLLLGEPGVGREGGGDLEVVLGELAGHRVHRDVRDGGVLHEDALDLEAGDVLAPAARVV